MRNSNARTRASLVALVCLALLVVSCASYTIHRKMKRRYPRIRVASQIECFIDPPPASLEHLILAVVDSSSATTSTAEVRRRQLDELRAGAAKAGAEAVHSVRVLTRETRGLIRDPYTPFPAPAQGWRDEYFLRGDAVLFEKNYPEDMPRFRPTPPEDDDEDGGDGDGGTGTDAAGED